MTIINQLATSLNRRDEVPNQELAKKIVQSHDKNAVKELIDNLKNKDKNIQADCIKVLYEIGGEQPVLIKDYMDDFTALLNSKNNRLAWGGMTALNYITTENPDAIYKLLPKLIDAANSGSVITRDNLVGILIKLEAQKKYAGKVFPLLIEQITTCPTNQLPMYAENAIPVINDSNKLQFIKILQRRLPELESKPKKNRILKVIKKVESL
ncbi:MAG: hypothetical protein JWQ09_1086 [Segetibacter sp.]|nr:hypothetical protein [Segetibacter sp.]